MNLKRAYLAGPDVFRRDAREHGKRMKELCAQHDLDGQFPLDNELVCGPDESPQAFAARIRLANLNLLASCDVVLANVCPFRGPHADDGTAYEMGYACAMSIPVFAYSYDNGEYRDENTLLAKVRRYFPFTYRVHATDEYRDEADLAVENFGLPVNLMLVGPETGSVHSSFPDVLRAAQKYLAGR